MAFIFAIVFAAIGYGISFLFSRFLDMDGDGESSQGIQNGARDGGRDGFRDGTKKGQVVDVVIQDDDLPSDAVTGQYLVGSNRRMLNDSDISSSGGGFAQATPQSVYQNASVKRPEEKKSEEQNPGTGGSVNTEEAPLGAPKKAGGDQFVPVRNLETLFNVSGKEAVSANSSSSSIESGSGGSFAEDGRKYSAADEDLDTLPSLEGMDDIGYGSSVSGGHDNDGFNNETDFATSGSSFGGSHREAEEPEIKDAPLMAKAISSILANES